MKKAILILLLIPLFAFAQSGEELPPGSDEPPQGDVPVEEEISEPQPEPVPEEPQENPVEVTPTFPETPASSTPTGEDTIPTETNANPVPPREIPQTVSAQEDVEVQLPTTPSQQEDAPYGLVVLVVCTALALGYGIYKVTKTTERSVRSGDCSLIKSQLEAKKVELETSRTNLRIHEVALETLKRKVEEKMEDIRDDAVDAVRDTVKEKMGLDNKKGIGRAIKLGEDAKDAYDDTKEAFVKAKEAYEFIKLQCEGLQREVGALESSYAVCMGGMTGVGGVTQGSLPPISLPEKTVTALQWIIPILEKHAVAYHISGGFAAHLYGATRPINDIDIDISEEQFEAIKKDVEEYIKAEPGRFTNEKWDLFEMTLDYDGQLIDIDGVESAKVFDDTKKEWLSVASDINNPEVMEVEGMKLKVIPKEKLLAYKKYLDGPLQELDIAELQKHP